MVAAGGTTSPRSRAALSELVCLYWYPVYAFFREQRHAPEEAKDLTQGLFTDLLERRDLGAADAQRGRFRSWLLCCARHYQANQHDHATAQKRGGGVKVVSFDAADAEGRYAQEPTDGVTPERLYLRRWARLLIDHVLAELRAEADRAGRLERFDLLRPYLVDEGELSYAGVGERLGIEAKTVKGAVFILRERFRERLRTEIAGTVVSVEEIDGEIRELLGELT